MRLSVVSPRQVSKIYRMDDVEVVALSDVTLDLAPSRFTVVSGQSGSGKTTLLNIIGCIDKPDQGVVVIAGTSLAQLSDDALAEFHAKNIGYIYIGRLFLYGLGAGGRAGVTRVLEILRNELDISLALCGKRDVAQADHNLLWVRCRSKRSLARMLAVPWRAAVVSVAATGGILSFPSHSTLATLVP